MLRERFGGAVAQAASLLFVVTRSLADGLRLFLTAIVVQELSGLSLPVCGRAGRRDARIVYTFAGGMNAVVWTDVAQFVIYNAGAPSRSPLLLARLPDGWSDAGRRRRRGGQAAWLDLSPSLDEPVHPVGRAGRRRPS